ncbi:flagellin N-terminal helical domain-containing protein [Spongorhabdus nitratireducens]
MLSTQTNTSAMLAQNQLAKAQNNLTTSMQRLTTGLRINSAADDAAGMQVASRMTTDIGAMDVAMRNANDAISMAQTAEGAMGETTGVLNRMRDLSLQAANDTNNSQDRSALQAEMAHLTDQVDTISRTEYAGIPVMSKDQTLSFQVGVDAGQTMNMSFTDLSASALKGDLKGGEFEAGSLGSATHLKLSAGNPVKPVTVDLSGASTNQEVIDTINNDPNMKRLGISAELKGSPVKMELVGVDIAATPGMELNTTTPGTQTVSADAVEKSLEEIDISTRAGAMQATKVLDGALPQVDKQRAELGAAQNRLEHTVNNLQNTQENLTTSKSRITDADFAKETTEMTKNQMMLQAGNTVLAQAKQMPQYAAQLLG